MADCTREARESAVRHEGGIDCDVAERRRSERVAIRGPARHLLPAEVPVLRFPVELVVRYLGNELRHTDRVLAEVAEHLVRAARDRMAADAARFAEEEQRTALLASCHRTGFTARVPVDRRSRKSERELELGDRPREHVVVDRGPLAHWLEDFAEQAAVLLG